MQNAAQRTLAGLTIGLTLTLASAPLAAADDGQKKTTDQESPAFVFTKAFAFQQGRAAVRDRSGRWGFIDTSGRPVGDFVYDHAGSFSEGLAVVVRDGLSGYVDLDGKVVIEPQYNRGALHFQGGLAKVHHYDKASNTWTLACIDRQGQVVVSANVAGWIRCEFSADGGWAVAGKGGRKGYINREGQMLRITLPPEWQAELERQRAEAKPEKNAEKTSEKTAEEAAENARLGKKPQQTLSPQEWADYAFDDAHAFREGLAAVALGGRWGFIDPQGRIAFVASADKVRDFHEGLAAIQRSDGRYAFVDRQGKPQTGFDYLEALDFSEGLAPVRTQEGWGYIDSRGQWAIAPRYFAVGPFKNDRARVCREQKDAGVVCDYIDRSGQVAISIGDYSNAQDFSEGFAAVRQSRLNRWGFIDAQGKPLEIKPPTREKP